MMEELDISDEKQLGSDNRHGVIEFSSNFHGKVGLDSVQNLCAAELKLLEQMEVYADRRAKLDSEYADKLSKLHVKITPPEDENIQSSLIGKAWRTYMTESENKAITISNMSKLLLQQIVPRIKTLHARKKEVLENFEKARSRLERDFGFSTNEKTRLENNYKDAIRDAAKWREKLDDSYSKVKGQKDWHKFKTHLDGACRKLHMNHNDYLLSICSLNEHNTTYNNTLIPWLLTSLQTIQQKFVEPWKEIFLDMQANTCWCREEFQTSEHELQQSIEFITPLGEYEGFVSTKKQTPTATLPYFFDTTLLQDKKATDGLTENGLAVNDLTVEQLDARKESFNKDEIKSDGSIKSKADDLTEQEKVLDEMTLSENNKAIFSTIQQCVLCHNLKLEVEEYQCKSAMFKVQKHFIEEALSAVGDEGPQPYILVEPPVGTSTVTLPNRIDVPSPSTPDGHRKNRSSTMPKFFDRIKRRESIKKQRASSIRSNSSNDSHTSYDEPYESLDLSPWFHGKIDRINIQRLLKQDGDFLVREKSDGSGTRVLSVLWKGHTKHFILQPVDGGYKLEAESFTSIPALINHHHDNRLVIQAATGVILINPIKRAFVPGDKYIIPHQDISLSERLGSGHFGDVHRGTLLSTRVNVAIKTCKENVDEKVKQRFLQEAEIMKPCVHKNVVSLIGVCVDKEPYYIVLELCDKGDLLNVLKREGVRIETKQQYHMAIDIAKGMAYLEKKQIIHRDLAARNCLVTKDYTVKVSDFGMSREEDQEGIYTISQTKEIPFKWCAPEVWQYTTYSTKTDVWSYGVTLWEVFSLGNTPYPGWNNKQTREKIDSGYRMQPPNGTPPQIFQIMQNCWNSDSAQRPHFSEIVVTLDRMKVLFG